MGERMRRASNQPYVAAVMEAGIGRRVGISDAAVEAVPFLSGSVESC